jgi:hypothetical protein
MINSPFDISANIFKVYVCDYIFMMRIKVSDGPLINGNTYAELEVYYKSNDYDAVDKVYYVEYGPNPLRKYIGSNVVWNNINDYNNDSLIVFE